MIWPFRREPRPQPPAPPEGDSPEEWCVGDMAECVSDGNCWVNRHGWLGGGPVKGDVRMVTSIIIGHDARTYLVFARWDPSAYRATCFRKITPRADEAKRGTVTRLSDLLRAPVRETDDA